MGDPVILFIPAEDDSLSLEILNKVISNILTTLIKNFLIKYQIA